MESNNMDDPKHKSQASQNSSVRTKFNKLNPNREDSHNEDIETFKSSS